MLFMAQALFLASRGEVTSSASITPSVEALRELAHAWPGARDLLLPRWLAADDDEG
jgi:hypothetical protein